MDKELPHLEFLPDLHKFAVRLIRSGDAYVDFSTDAEIEKQRATETKSSYRDNNPIIDVMLFQTYALTRVGSGVPGCLRLKILNDPIIYRRINDAIYPTHVLYRPVIDYKNNIMTDQSYIYNYIQDKYRAS